MVREDLIKQVATEISNRLLTPVSKPITVKVAADTLLIFDQDTVDTLRTAITAAQPQAAIFTTSALPTTEALIHCKTLVVVTSSLDLASKIGLLQTHCAVTSLIISALMANKRVVFVTTGMLASSSLDTGIGRAITQLRDKLRALGIELFNPEEWQKAFNPSMSIILPVVNAALAEHPSQQRVRTANNLSDFVEFLQSKQCTMEKGKPCDECDICNSMGF